VTTHFVCQSLRHGGCVRGLSAGVNLPMNWETSAMFVGAGMTATDGRCKTMDTSADGYVRSEACVAVLFRQAIATAGPPTQNNSERWLDTILTIS
jgi:acyl transferase domain-containing protein